MDLDALIITIFCQLDDAFNTYLAGQRLRQRGPHPVLCDSEVLTMEVIGEYLGLDQDRHLFDYFRRHFAHFFPALSRIHRTTFTRQAANLWQVKAQLWQQVMRQMTFNSELSLIDSFPVPVCRFARARWCRRLREHSAFGFDEMAKQTFYGMRAHLRVCWPGVIVSFSLAPANVHELAIAEQLFAGVHGHALGDRNYWSPRLAADLNERGLKLLAPYRSAKREKKRWPLLLVQTRRRIETVIGQLTERFHAKRIWARDARHCWSRFLRKVLAHTLFVQLCQQYDLLPLRLAELVSD